MIFLEQANHYGTLFGGTPLSLMGKAAFVAANRHARAAMVMAASERIEFHRAVPVGKFVELHALVIREERSSLTVEVAMTAESLTSCKHFLAANGHFKMVCIDESGKPLPIRPHSVVT
ncbi:acyl-CoA thioesterase [Novosphingobium beihaiensis]|uniref:Acyl-CoA thioesterase n=1 Tax=Novosphingobium beihaiensis TaxID=2930389 RepID=A0ABT0BWB6_9SPHN|nr:acyl-CoA thioesterase [Novosphingobium beihaiensis]MCJ2189248.1 acyl-CoA thioesterase [Novosphingobium beihaiensis]